MENKNTIVALVLMLLVWTGFTFLFPPSDKSVDVEPQISVQSDEHVSSNIAELPVLSLKEVQSSSNVAEKIVTVENNVFIAKFSTKFASLIDLKLKKYKKSLAEDSDLVSLLDQDKSVNSLIFSGTDDFSTLGQIFYSTDVESVNVLNTNKLIFKANISDSIQVIKSYVFDNDSYAYDVNIQFINRSDESLSGSIILSLNNFWSDDMEGNRLEFIGPVVYSDEKINTVDVDDINSDVYKNTLWSGFENKYFISTLINNDAFDYSYLSYVGGQVSSNLLNKSFTVNPNSVNNFSSKVFFGPKDLNILKSVGYDLNKAVDFGFFKILAQPLYTTLNFFYGFIGNYGFSIIILTVILKLMFWPLTQKSYVSMKAMQKLQPEMKKLREKYSSDKETLNRKMMELYKEHRVNPLGGCLPMLVQIPVFFALYKVLLDTIELRHAPFALWITDLSVKDPYYVTPLIMGLTMFIQQKLTPNTMDPMQAKMMLAMPVVFTFLFLNFPSGLVIYWLVNNLLTIFQQYLIYKKQA
ncbi:MAG: protein translocase component YidC [Desulfuromonas sp.]|nr:MAG: protein translocase component YidC [Desulfuromonas sp.]